MPRQSTTTFGALLRQHRVTAGLTQEALAERAGLSVYGIQKLEAGTTHPYRDTAVRLVAALELSTAAAEQLRAAVEPLRRRASPPHGSTGGDRHHNLPIARDTPAHTLPRQATRLVGRERETTDIVSQLRSTEVRLLTLTGPGGIGKTRLALEAADTLQHDTLAVYFVSLASITDASLVVAAIAQALGLPDAGGRLRDNLRNYLRDKSVLLVLDNFEHLLSAALLVTELLSEAPDLKVLVTSREVLRVSGEHTFEVPPLRLPDLAELPAPERLSENAAVSLFLQRAQAVKSDIRLNKHNARCVAEICHRLDGLPLALEFAAARVRHLEPAALLPRLERRLSVLTNGARDMPTRQQTLRGTIGWSYDLLSSAEQALFRRLAIFVGGFTLEAAEAVCDFEAADELTDVLDGVGSLIDKSLIRQEPASGEGNVPRYTMLETVREYGLEQLAATGEESLTRSRHAAYYERLVYLAVPHFLGPEQLEWLARIGVELDNLRTVWQWLLDHDQRERGQQLAGSLWYFWGLHVSEGLHWLTRLLDGPSGDVTSAGVRARSLLALGLTAAKQYDQLTERSAFTESLRLAQVAGDAWTAALALTRLTETQINRWAWGDASAAAEHVRPRLAAQFHEAICMFRGLSDEWGAAVCMTFYANFLAASDPVHAGELASEAVAIADKLGERYVRHMALSSAALVDLELGKFSEARELMEMAAALGVELNDLFNVGQKLVRLAHLEMDESRFASALGLYERAISNDRLLGNRVRLAEALHHAGIAARLTGSADGARSAFEESLRMCRGLGQAGRVAAVRVSLGHLYLQQGKFSEGVGATSEGLAELTRQETELGIASAACGMGRLALMAGSPQLAAHLLGAAEALLDRLLAGPYSTSVKPSQHGANWFQFHRDRIHVRELRAALAPKQLSRFDVAVKTGRALNTHQTISLARQVATQFAESPAVFFFGPDGQRSVSPLSQREAEVLRLVAEGNSNEQIAATLVLSVRTVERHIANVYAKIGARNRADATAYALRNDMT